MFYIPIMSWYLRMRVDGVYTSPIRLGQSQWEFYGEFHDIKYYNFCWHGKGTEGWSFMGCEESFTTMKPIWQSYLVFSLGNCVHKTLTETGLTQLDASWQHVYEIILDQMTKPKQSARIFQWRSLPCLAINLSLRGDHGSSCGYAVRSPIIS